MYFSKMETALVLFSNENTRDTLVSNPSKAHIFLRLIFFTTSVIVVANNLNNYVYFLPY